MGYVQEEQAHGRPLVTMTQVPALLEASLDALGAETFRRVWGSPGYDEQHMTSDDLRASLQPNIRSIVRALGTTDELEPQAMHSAEQIGEMRSLQGVPVDAVMQSWAIAERVLLDHLLAHAETLSVPELRAAVTRVGDVIGRLSRHSVEAYRRTQEEVTVHYDRLTTDLVARLTGMEPTDVDEVRRRARTIGVDPDVPHAALALAVRAPGPEAYLRVQRHLLGTIAGNIRGRVLIGSIDEFPLLLIPAPDGAAALVASLTAALTSPRCPDPLLVGLSDEVAPLPGAGRLCQDARDALEVGLRLDRSGQLVRSHEVAPETLLLRNREVADALLHRIAPLLDRPELLETLRAYLASGLSARETSRRLYVHPNTVPYRLRLIERLLNRTLTDVEGMADVVLALRAWDMRDRHHE